jgi:predicted phage baseplate assembly protein
VPLPEITLDDRHFQDIVNEARARIALSCPEWTEHNVSDPGITLIELFAWMTDMLVYRLNRVPDKLHLALLELLGIRLDPPTAASAELRFRLGSPAAEPVAIPAVRTEVGTVRTATEESIVFQTSDAFTIPAITAVAYAVERGGTVKDVGVASGVARPKGPDQLPFGMPPAPGDGLYLGFDEPLARLLVQIDVDCSQARGAGVDPEDPPLRWEVSTGEAGAAWAEARVLSDRTGGFNYGSGIIELELPTRTGIESVGGRRAHWLRCRLDALTRSGVAGAVFSHPPEIYSLAAGAIGARIPAVHAQRETNEVLGESDGTPGQRFELRHSPVLAPRVDETLEVRVPGSTDWQPWERRDSFAESGPSDLHYLVDPAAGEIELGPAIRSAGGEWVQHGSIPPKGATLRFAAYRHGGGRTGNVAAGTLTMLKEAIPGVASVTNPFPADGGVDREPLASARRRASMEIRARYRAVTAEDFEYLCGAASRRVARAICVPVGREGVTRVHILPRVEDADRQLAYHELAPGDDLLAEVSAFLDDRRLVGTTVQLAPVRLRGISVVVNVQASPRSDLARVERDVATALYRYLNPLTGGSASGHGEGWEFGRALNQGEVFGVVHAVEGVEFVKILRVYETDLVTGQQDPKPAGTHIELEADEVIASGAHVVKAEHREA